MADLDTLRPEVGKADSFLDSMACSADEEAAVKTIRAELLRLAEYEQAAGRLAVEKAEFRQRAEQYEAELAALKSQPISGPAHDAIIRFGCGEVLSHEEMCEIVNQAVCAGRELAALKARMADACPTDRGGVNNVSSNACSKG
jgi:hypothetical protein